ncbi:DUF3558 family protein [Pseudonocardia xishanensis]|uniref:DUF3558 domain-containing protein n=1 Tax=Pseudonocardia xishanensis TaxID=630995 RepID=A0ABP8RI50_9PSEU
MTHSKAGPAAAALLGALLLAGCSSTVAGTPTAQDGQVRPLDETPAGAAAASAAVDGCALVTAAEVKALIGPNDGGRAGGIDSGGGGCTWENKENYFSVTVEVRSVGTAPGGTIPPWDTSLGPERKVGTDMRDINGAIEFAAGDRDCTVQVATTDFAVNEKAALDLIPKIRQRIG